MISLKPLERALDEEGYSDREGCSETEFDDRNGRGGLFARLGYRLQRKAVNNDDE